MATRLHSCVANSRARHLLAFQRVSSCTSRFSLHTSRFMSTSPQSMDTSSRNPSTSSPDLNKIVDDISNLTLLQAADLVTLLKTRLNIQEIALPSSAPPSTTVDAALADEAPPEEQKPKEKTIFSVKIQSIDPAAKAKIIREVKAQVPNLNLLEAKKFVESLPKVVKENVPKEDAEKLKTTFEGLGAIVVLE